MKGQMDAKREQNTEERIKQLETLFLLHDCQGVSHEWLLENNGCFLSIPINGCLLSNDNGSSMLVSQDGKCGGSYWWCSTAKSDEPMN